MDAVIADRIEPLDKRRSKVFLDGSFAFVLYRGELSKYGIEEGQSLSEDTVRCIFEEVICRRARERSLYLLKYSGKTEIELRRKLKAGWYPDEAVDRAVDFLKRYGYIDDLRYVRNYVEAYGGQKSRAEIQNRLREKGIDRDKIQAALEEAEPDEEGQIRRMLEKRHYSSEHCSREEKRKHTAYLVRKGFPYEMVRRVMGE